MNAPDTLLICEHCDTVYRRVVLARGDVVRCARCNAILERHHGLGRNSILALVTTAMIVFVLANVWPIVTLGISGQHNSATLWGTIIAMWREGAGIIAVLAAATLFFFPLWKMLSIGWLMWFARNDRRAPGFVPLMVSMHYLRPWTMSEVFVLGALVAIVKAGVYFEVTPGAGIYAYTVLMLLITVFASIDLRYLWEMTRDDAA